LSVPQRSDLAADRAALPHFGACTVTEEIEEASIMAAKLYIGGLAYSTTSEGLREFFAQCGTVESATVITDRFSGQSRGFGFVEMATTEDAQRAISQLSGRDLDGRRITVELSNPQAARPAGGRPGGGRPGGGGRGPGGGGGRESGYAHRPSKPVRW
jgi:RNA recognition motif-containing protein